MTTLEYLETQKATIDTKRKKVQYNGVNNNTHLFTNVVSFTPSTGRKYINKDIIYSTQTEKERVIDLADDTFHILLGDLKNDIREREERTRREISDREMRFEKQLTMVAEANEKREERILSSILSVKSDIVETVKASEERIKETENRMVSTIDKIESIINTHSTNMENMKTQNFWGNVAMFVGMFGVIIAVVIAMIFY